ncbi:hypothetical protein F5Y10DRAFT_291325 [Nemania abortiva]|nr:hypothetical protein F5Y10DRAFT_291325 [Nemania abortiva]
MALSGNCALLKELEDDLLANLQAMELELPCMAGSDSSDTASSSRTSTSDSSNNQDSSSHRSDIDRLSPIKSDSRGPSEKIRRTVRGPLSTLRTDTSEPGDIDSEARFTDWDGETFLYEPNGSYVGTIFDDGRSEIAPEDSVSMRDVHRAPYEKKRTKYEDRLTKLGYVERLPDIQGRRHYRIELAIDKLIEENKVRTALGTINLSSSELAILNSDGLQPKLASDLDSFHNGFLEVKKSPVSGYGVFAARDLEPYTPILMERELFNANSFNLYQKLEDLTDEQKKAYHNLHGHKRRSSEDDCAAIWRTNRFSIAGGSSVFLVASRFNHACKTRNNVDYSYDSTKRCMVFVTKGKVAAGDELFISYSSDPRDLYTTWGFQCACGGCTGTKPLPYSEDDHW